MLLRRGGKISWREEQNDNIESNLYNDDEGQMFST